MTKQILTEEQAFARTIKEIDFKDTSVSILLSDGATIKQHHDQDCCEYVEITQIDGTISNHIGAVIYSLEEKITTKEDLPPEEQDQYDSATFTFYTLKTSKGYLDWRWTGESNGYYSESVDCIYTQSKEI
jgi:hypothetical protein